MIKQNFVKKISSIVISLFASGFIVVSAATKDIGAIRFIGDSITQSNADGDKAAAHVALGEALFPGKRTDFKGYDCYQFKINKRVSVKTLSPNSIGLNSKP